MKVQLPECEPESYQEYAFVGDSGVLQIVHEDIRAQIQEILEAQGVKLKVYVRTVEATYWPWTEISENE